MATDKVREWQINKDRLARLLKTDKAAEKVKRERVGQNSSKIEGKVGEKDQEMGKWRTEEEKCPVKWWSGMRASMLLHPLCCNTNTTLPP